jgi:uncharacterized protein (DUF934 family)
LADEEGPESIGSDIDDFTVIGLAFDKFSDGKSYSTASRLREQYGYQGELRAIGDVPHERVSYQHQVGLDAFVVRANQKINTVLTGLTGADHAGQTGRQLAAVAG